VEGLKTPHRRLKFDENSKAQIQELSSMHKNIKKGVSQVWWCMPVIQALERLRQENQESEPSQATY
jgi:hypothetical protein